MKGNRDVLIELLRMRGFDDAQASSAADLLDDLLQNKPLEVSSEKSEGEEHLNEFLREAFARALLLPLQLFLERVPAEERERILKKLL